MAQFRISAYRNGKHIETITVTGRKIPVSNVRKYSGDEEAKRYDHYIVSKPNLYGIKWVVIDKEGNRRSDVAGCIEAPILTDFKIFKIS